MFYVVEENPNCVTGGCGDVAGEVATSDCHGPYVVFPATDMENIISPHTVICAYHLKQAYHAVFGPTAQILAGGERTDDVTEAAPIIPTPASTRESAVIGDDIDDPDFRGE